MAPKVESFHVLGLIIVTILTTIPLVNIFRRAGLNPALGFIGLLPFLGTLIAIGILAFKEWPNEPAGYR